MKRNRLFTSILIFSIAFSLCACLTDPDSLPSDPSTQTPSEPTHTHPAVTDPSALHYGLYIQDGQLFYADLSGEITSFQLGNKLLDEDPYYWLRMGYLTDVYVSPDGEYIVYPQNQSSDYAETLYFLDLTNPEAAPILIGTGRCQSVSVSFDQITYLTGAIGSGDLYQSDLTSSTLIDSGVAQLYSYNISKDGKSFLYNTADLNSLYLKKDGKEPELITRSISWFQGAENFNTVFYIRGEVIFVKKQGQEERAIASGVMSTSVKIYEDGTAYCVSGELNGIFSLNFQIDPNVIKTLYYYDGQQVHVISNEVTIIGDWARDSAVIAYETASGSYIAAKDTVGQLPQGSYRFSDDGKYAYLFVKHSDGTSRKDLYRLTLDGAQVIQTEFVTDQVADATENPTKDGKYFLFKDVVDDGLIKYSEKFQEYYSNDKGTLYMNNTFVDDNVRTVDLDTMRLYQDGKLYYLKDWNPETFHGTLRVFDGEEAVTVMDNVYDMILNPGGDLLFLRNYDSSAYAGELWVYRNGVCEKIADNVNQLIRAIDTTYDASPDDPAC